MKTIFTFSLWRLLTPKSKAKNRKHSSLLLLVLLFVGSCIEDLPEDANHEPLPALKFKDAHEMLSFFYSQIDDDPNLRTASGNNTAYESFRVAYKNAVTELGEAESSEKHNLLLKKHRDILTIQDSTYVPKITNPFYQIICNRDGIYLSGGYAHKVIDSRHIIIAPLSQVKELQGVTLESVINSEKFKVAFYNTDGYGVNLNGSRVNADCGATLQVVYFDNHTKCKDDRRVYIRAYAYYAISGDDYTPSAISEAWGEIRTAIFCNWKIYDTEVRTQNCSFTVSASLNENIYDFPMIFPDKITTSGDHILQNGAVAQPITWQGGTVPTIQFTKIHEEATSRGVGYTNWAIIDCQ